MRRSISLLAGCAFLLVNFVFAEDAPPALRPFRVATDYASIQAAIDALPETGGTVYIPEGRFVLDKPLDLTKRNYHTLLHEEDKAAGRKSRTGSYVHLLGSGNGTILEGRMKEGPVIDMTDSSYCTISQLRIHSETAQCGILLARPHPKNRKDILLSCGWHTFYNVNITGSYSVAAVYNQASEVDRWYGCQFGNMHPDAYCVVFTYRNFAGIVSPYAGELCEVGSNSDERFIGCLFAHHAAPPKDKDNPQGATIYVQGWATDFSVTDCDFGVSGVKATVWLDGERNPNNGVHITNNRFENKATYLVLATGGNNQVSFTGNTCPGAVRNFIHSTGSAMFWEVRGNQFNRSELPDTPPMSFENLKDSTIERNWCILTESPGKEKQTPQIVVSGTCEACNIEVPRREDFQGNAVRTRLTATNDGGTRREYLGASNGDTVLNFKPVDTKKISNPKTGDVALDDGTNPASKKPALAVFDGTSWHYAN